MGIFGSSDDGVDDGGLRRRVEELERRIAALEWELRSTQSALAAAPAPSTPAYDGPGGTVSAEVRQLALNGQKIQAIKMLREQSGLGLKESKDIVDQLAP